VNFNGTTLVAGASSSNFISNITNANVAAGGAKFDTNGKDITIGQVLKHSDVGTVALNVTNGGAGYGTNFSPANTPLVVLTQPGNPAAYGTATPVLNAAGAVVGLTNVNAQNFTGAPTVTITNPSGGSGLAISSTFTPAAATDGGLTKSGAGSLTLTGANTYNGPTAVNGGLLNVNGALASNVSVASGASLGGVGTINGSLTFANNTELQVQTNGTFLTANTVNAAGAVVTITPLGVIPGTPTTILNAPGGITGTVGTNFVLTSRGTISEIGNTTLQISTSGPGSLVWSGAQSSAWNIQQTQNWTNGGTPDVYYNLDNVTFNDTAVNRNVNLTTNVTPGSVTIDHSTGADYVFTGAAITGNTGLTKSGTGTAVIANANTFSGGTTISAGTLQLGDGVNGVGSLGSGPITNNGTLAVDYGANNGALANAVSGSGGLTKNGSGILSVSAANTYTGTTNINAGTVQLDGAGTLGTGDVVNNAALVANTTATLANTISGNGTLATSGSANLTVTGTNSYTGGTTIATGTTINVGNGGTTGTLGSGPITNSGTLAFNRSDAVVAPSLAGGTVSQIGAGTLTLSGTNTTATLNIGLNANNTGTVIVPAGVSLSVGNAGTGNLIVGQATGATAAKGQLDASAASSFAANVATFGVGLTGNSNGAGTGTLNLPANSTITATTAFTIGESAGSRAGDTGTPVAVATTAAGGTTSVATPTFQIGNGKSSAAFTLGAGNTLQVAGIGVGGRANLYVENMSLGGGGGTYAATADLSQGILNASLSSLFVGNQSFTVGSTVNLTGTMTISNNAANHLDISGASTANSRVLPTDPNSALLNPGVVVVGRIDGVGNTGSVTGTLTIGNLDATSVITSTNNGTAIVVGGTNSANASGYSATGTLNLNGGTLKFVTTGAAIAGGTLPDPTATPANAATRSTVNFNGMTLVAGASSANWIHGIGDTTTAASGAVVQGGGVIVDTNGFDVTVPQTFVSGGGTDGGLVKKGLGTLSLTSSSTYTGATRVEKGTLRATPAAYNTLLSNAAGVVFAGDGAKLVLDYTGGTTPLAQVRSILASGYDGSFASGQIHAASALPGNRTLGYGDDGAGQLTVMQTIPGDANLDGMVNFNDFLVLQNNFNSPDTTFAQGNFNYDATTNFNDFLILQNNFGTAIAGLTAAVSKEEYAMVMSITSSGAVPEPTAIGLLGLGAAGLLSRRRRAN
jgi:autotransporter-associated beta strand protein